MSPLYAAEALPIKEQNREGGRNEYKVRYILALCFVLYNPRVTKPTAVDYRKALMMTPVKNYNFLYPKALLLSLIYQSLSQGD